MRAGLVHRLEYDLGDHALISTPVRGRPRPWRSAALLLVALVGGGAEGAAAESLREAAGARVGHTSALLQEPPVQDTTAPAAAAPGLDTSGLLQDSAVAGAPPLPVDTAGPPEDPYGVEVDEDGDGVPVFADWCPGTAPGVAVDERGCATSRIPWWGWLVGVVGGFGALSAMVRGVRASLARRRRARIARYGREVDHELEDLARHLGEPPEAAPWLAGGGGAEATGGDPTDASRPGHPPPAGAAPPAAPPFGPGHPAAAHPPATGVPAPSVGFPLPRPEPLDLDFEGTRVPADLVPPDRTGEPSAGFAEVARGSAPAESASPSSAVPAGITRWKQEPLRFDASSDASRGRRIPWLAGAAAIVLIGSIAVAVRSTGRAGAERVGVQPLPRSTDQPVVVAFTEGEADPSAPPGTQPARMLLLAGDGQQAPAGARLPEPIAVRVEDANGVPVPGVRVFFEATIGGGRVLPLLVPTDSTGVAQTSWRLGRGAERQYVIARVEGYEDGAGVAFEAVAVAGEAAALRLLAGAGQTGTANLQLDSAVVMRVEDEQGNGVPGVLVEFELDEGEGTVSPTEAESDSTGTVRAYWTLGEGASAPTLEARVRDAPDLTIQAGASLVYPLLEVRSGVVTGGTHTCQLLGNGGVRCWGSNQTGQLGTGDGQASRVPRAVPAGTTFSSIAAGLSHTCAVTQDGVAMCWGDNASGQLGTGDTRPRAAPTAVAGEVRFRSVVAGPAHTCAVSRGGRGYCWGSNTSGQLGDGSRSDQTAPVRIALDRPLQEISAGWTHTCALALDGAGYCWGRNAFGQVGDGSGNDRATPAPIGGAQRFRRIAAGSAHTCAVRADGQLACWGQNNYGQLGTGDREARAEPTAVAEGPFRSVTTGGVHTCALSSEGAVSCWGRNTYGQLGDGSEVDRAVPGPVVGDLSFRSIQASGAHTCGTDGAGATYCWGFNIEGQLGDGTRQNRNAPVRVGGG